MILGHRAVPTDRLSRATAMNGGWTMGIDGYSGLVAPAPAGERERFIRQTYLDLGGAGLSFTAFTSGADFSFLRGVLTIGSFVALWLWPRIACTVLVGTPRPAGTTRRSGDRRGIAPRRHPRSGQRPGARGLAVGGQRQ